MNPITFLFSNLDETYKYQIYAPKAHDGKPIMLGETLYGINDNKPWLIVGYHDNDENNDYEVIGRYGRDYKPLKGEWLQHHRKETFEDIIHDIVDHASGSMVQNHDIMKWAERCRKVAENGR